MLHTTLHNYWPRAFPHPVNVQRSPPQLTCARGAIATRLRQLSPRSGGSLCRVEHLAPWNPGKMCRWSHTATNDTPGLLSIAGDSNSGSKRWLNAPRHRPRFLRWETPRHQIRWVVLVNPSRDLPIFLTGAVPAHATTKLRAAVRLKTYPLVCNH